MADSPPESSDSVRRRVFERLAKIDSAADPAFDRLVALATQLFGVRMAGLSIVAGNRQLIKAFAGGPTPDPTLVDSVSRVAIGTRRVFQVSDATAEPLFASDPSVVGGAGVRFLAAAPLVSAEGVAVGALSIFDSQRRNALDPREIQLLADLAASAVDEIEAFARLGGSEAAGSREQVLRQSEQTFRSLVEGMPDAVFVLDGGTIAYANAAAAQMLGFLRPADLVGRSPIDFVHPDHKPIMTALVQNRVPVGRVPQERHLLRQDGSSVLVEARGANITFRGHPALLGVYRDLTDRRTLEARLRHSERMASLGTLAAGVGHEINNPLSFVVANLAFATTELARTREALARMGGEIAGAEANTMAEVLAALSEAAEGAERVRRIVRDLKNVWRTQESPKTLVNVADAIESALGVSDHEVRQRARLVKQLLPVPAVEANEAELTELFVNLLLNAAQSIPDGAGDRNEVTISTSFDAAAHQVVIEIRDTGSGMTPEVRERIFDPFFTTRPVGSGTGLGLAICHSIVTGAGGDISVTSEPGVGSVFRVMLPAKSEAQLPQGERAVIPERRGRVLVVDDEELVGRSLRRSLGREQDVENVTRGAEALRRLEGGERYDIILCDLAMPEMTGIQLYERIEALDRDQADRMLFITGGTFTEAGRAFLKRFPGRCFDKPFEAQALRAAIRKRLAEQPPVRHLRIAK